MYLVFIPFYTEKEFLKQGQPSSNKYIYQPVRVEFGEKNGLDFAYRERINNGNLPLLEYNPLLFRIFLSGNPPLASRSRLFVKAQEALRTPGCWRERIRPIEARERFGLRWPSTAFSRRNHVFTTVADRHYNSATASSSSSKRRSSRQMTLGMRMTGNGGSCRFRQ